MIVITDSNIIISAILTPHSLISKIIFDKNIQFVAPSFIIDEIKNHQIKIIEISNISKKVFNDRMFRILEKIEIIDIETIPKVHKNKALEIVKDIDIFDMFFVALHLYKKHKIWTGDKILISGLKEKGYNICITTSELKEYLYKK